MALEIEDEIRSEVNEWVAAGNRQPHLCAVLVGDDPASHVYVRNKMIAAEYTGMKYLLGCIIHGLCYPL